MGQSVDDLLNAIKQEYEQTNAPSSAANEKSESQSSSKSPLSEKQEQTNPSLSGRSRTQDKDPSASANPLSKTSESIDDLLADLGVTPKESAPPPTPFSTVRDSSERVASPSSSAPIPSGAFPSSASFGSGPTHKAVATDSLLNQVKQQYKAEEAERERQRQKALEADRRLQRQLEEQARQQQMAKELRQQELEQQHKAKQLKNAEAWIKELDPSSDEGFWFESFAVNYPSKLEAALEYLDAMDRAN